MIPQQYSYPGSTKTFHGIVEAVKSYGPAPQALNTIVEHNSVKAQGPAIHVHDPVSAQSASVHAHGPVHDHGSFIGDG